MNNQQKEKIWTNLEDQILKAGIMKYGINNWSKISSLLTHKTPTQCQHRWNNYINPRIKNTPWTDTEDTQLLKFIKVFPNHYTLISQQLNRTPQQCIDRYNYIKHSYNQPTDQNINAFCNPESLPPQPDPIDFDIDSQEMLSITKNRLLNTKTRKQKRKEKQNKRETPTDHHSSTKDKEYDYLKNAPTLKPLPGIFTTENKEKSSTPKKSVIKEEESLNFKITKDTSHLFNTPHLKNQKILFLKEIFNNFKLSPLNTTKQPLKRNLNIKNILLQIPPPSQQPFLQFYKENNI